MSSKFRNASKKTVVLMTILVVILLVVAVTGTVVFLKNRGSAEATDLNSEQVDRQINIEGQSSEGRQEIQAGEQAPVQQTETQNQGQQGNAQEGAQGTENVGQENIGAGNNQNANPAQTTTPGQNAQTTNVGQNAQVRNPGQGNVGTTTTDNIQETTITRTETVEIPEQQTSEGHFIGWSANNIEIEDNHMAADKINAQYDDISVEKVAETKAGTNVATKGDTITYKIKVTNNSSRDLNGIEVKDRIPEMTTYVNGTVDNNGTEIKEKNNIVGLVWKLDLHAGEEKVVSFEAKVNENATGTIKNIAIANGKETQTVGNSIIEASKTTEIEGKQEGETAQKGDKIIYTITVKNTGDEKGIANVQDTKLQELIDNGTLKVVEESEETAKKLIEGTTIEVEANQTATISFKTEILNINGAITNIAKIGEEETETTINTYGLEVSKELTKIERNKAEVNKDLPVKKGDILTYTIKVANIGSINANNVDIIDNLPAELKAQGQKEFKNVKVPAGETVTKTVVAVVENINGAIENTVTVTDKKNPEKIETTTEKSETIDISIDKKAELIKDTKNNEEGYEDIAEMGDKIHYTISVTNNGSFKLDKVNVIDEKMKAETTVEYLDAGETKTDALTVDHEVVATDFYIDSLGKMKTIYNKAVATYEDEENQDNNVTVEDEVNVTVREDYKYKVEYYYDGVKDETATETQVAKYGTKIEKYTDKVKIGYKFDKTENLPLQVKSNNEYNTINVYYVKDDKQTKPTKYTVKHVVDGEEKEAKEYTGTVWINEENPTIEIEKGSLAQKTYIGYKYDSIDSEAKEGEKVASETVITLTYVKDDEQTKPTKYTVKHVVAGEEKESKEYFGTAWINEENPTIEIKEGSLAQKTYTGYKYDSIDSEAKEGEKVASETVITLTYVKDDEQTKPTKYTVKHVVAGEEKETKEYTGTAWINEENPTIEIEKGSLAQKTYTGYKYESTTPKAKEGEKVASETVITLTYVKDDKQTKPTKYTVKHVVAGEEKESKEYTGTAWINEENPTIEIEKGSLAQKTYTGYKYDSIDSEAKEGEKVASETVITLTYIKDDEQTKPTKYTVKHVVAGEEKETKEYTGTAWINEENPTIEIKEGSLAQKTYTGYKYENIAPEVKEGEKVTSGTVITLTYIKDDEQTKQTKYTVKHVVDGEEKESQEYTGTVWINEENPTIEIKEGSLAQKTYTGYKYDSISPKAKEGEKVASETVITLTYVKDDKQTKPTKYTVKHVVDGEEKETKEYTGTAWINEENPTIEVKEGSLAQKTYTGYKYENIAPEVQEGEKVASETIIILTYVKDDKQTKPTKYTVKHVVAGEEKETKEYTGTAWINEENPTIEIEKGSLAQKTYTGYKYDSINTEAKEGEKVANGTVIILTYVKDDEQTQTIKYIVKHVVAGEEKETKEYTGTAWINEENPTIEIEEGSLAQKTYTGYKYDSISPKVKEGEKVASGTVITLTYVKNENETNTISYTVKHILQKQNEQDEIIKQDVYSENVWVLNPQVITIKDKTLTTLNKETNQKLLGYKLDTTEGRYPIQKEGESVVDGTTIIFYYIKDEEQQKELSYTLKYYKDGKLESSKIVKENVWINSEQTTLTVKTDEINTTDAFGDRYKFEKTNPTTIPNTITTGSTISVYYVSKPEPSILLTTKAINDTSTGEEITYKVFKPNTTNTFYYRLKVENIIENSYPEVIENQVVTNTLPEGIKVYGTLPTGVTKEIVTVNGIEREKITWTVNNIGYGNAAKYIDIPVIIDESVYKNTPTESLGTETTVLDVQFSQGTGGKADKETSTTDRTGKVVNLFLRTAGATNVNNGYIYAGTATVGTKPTKNEYASSTYNTETKINNAIANSTELPKMLDDFGKNQSNMSKYIQNGLPTKAEINANLAKLYNNKVTLSDTQVILWYTTNVNSDKKLSRYYQIKKGNTTIFNNYIDLEACSYHLDGIVVDVRDLGSYIPNGSQVNVTNTAELVGVTGQTQSTTIAIYYNELPSQRISTRNILKATAESVKDEESYEEIVAKIEEADKSSKTTQKAPATVIQTPVDTNNVMDSNKVEVKVEKDKDNDKELVTDKQNKTDNTTKVETNNTTTIKQEETNTNKGNQQKDEKVQNDKIVEDSKNKETKKEENKSVAVNNIETSDK